ncbi:ParA family protein [Roseomonas sp. M0104]|uniref:ParA family protein n=1 Tax=Teichococcus coralli TaxID=2545983 RepID=A0A845BLR9_9PROT|nr:ParA family protein [Pseudoroseomonas coralli]MXP66082.1 ParA family protein [Pseudoroseomonas coralli]
MGTILTVASGKGGCSKSTTVMILSANLATRGYRVAVVDADRNQSFASWHRDAYEGPELTCCSETDHIKVVDLAGELAESHDAVLIDTAGFENLTAASAIGMADYVLIPCMPDRGSVRETMRTAQQVASLSKAARRSIPYSVLLTRWKPRGLSERAALDSLQEEKLPILQQSFGDLADFTKLSFSGFVPTSGKVGDQAASLIVELSGKGAIPTIPSIRVAGKAA